MNILLNLVTFVIACLAAIMSAGSGSGLGGGDVGAAGVGVLLFIVPAAALGLLGAFLYVRFIQRPESPHVQRLVFIVAASILSAALAAAAMKLTFPDSTPPDPEFVYVPVRSYSATIEIIVPAAAVANEPVMVKIFYKGGPWMRVRYKDLSSGRFGGNFILQPAPAVETDVAGWLSWESDPYDLGGGILWGRPDPKTGEFPLTFRTPGTYKLWARTVTPTVAKSNVATITVRAK